jgi:hypothetical protein
MTTAIIRIIIAIALTFVLITTAKPFINAISDNADNRHNRHSSEPPLRSTPSKSGPQNYKDDAFIIQRDNSSVLDTNTNLIWKRCLEGVQFDGNSNDCLGIPRILTSRQALSFYEENKYKGSWRLPTIEEAKTITHTGQAKNINEYYFPTHHPIMCIFTSTPSKLGTYNDPRLTMTFERGSMSTLEETYSALNATYYEGIPRGEKGRVCAVRLVRDKTP